MNYEAESSRTAGVRDHDIDHDSTLDTHDEIVMDEEEEASKREKTAKERRLDAKRKRIVFLDHLLRELDSLVFMELITIYYLDCSFFWFMCRIIVQLAILTPLPDMQLARQQDDHKPFLPLILLFFSLNFLLHIICAAPSAGEDTRGYLHGGLMMDIIGQQGPTSKWKLAALDICILVLQVVMVSVYVKRRDLKKNLTKTAGSSSDNTASSGPVAEGEGASAAAANADRDQDADAEERGVLRRTDSLSDIGAEADEEDALLSSISESGHVDALDVLASGQCVIGDFHLVDTLLDEHQKYQAYRQTRPESGSSSSPQQANAIRQLNLLRQRLQSG